MKKNLPRALRAAALVALLALSVVATACDPFSHLECSPDSIPTGTIDGVEVRCNGNYYVPQ